MRHRLGLAHCFARGRGDRGDCLVGESHVEQLAPQSGGGENRLGIEIDPRRIVLVQRVDGHPLGRRPGGFGQRRTELVVAAVTDTDPIQGAQHDRLSGTGDHDASGTQGIVDSSHRRHQGKAQGRTDRRGDIGLERGQFQIVGRGGNGEAKQNERGRNRAEHGVGLRRGFLSVGVGKATLSIHYPLGRRMPVGPTCHGRFAMPWGQTAGRSWGRPRPGKAWPGRRGLACPPVTQVLSSPSLTRRPRPMGPDRKNQDGASAPVSGRICQPCNALAHRQTGLRVRLRGLSGR